ncbi:MAG: DUF63 family protein [Candidatus Aenigmatarchaeota archaeon]
MDLASFFIENFSAPLCRYYTPIGTATYGIILVLAVAGIYKLLQKLNVEINRNFLLSLLPFIIYGAWTRALRDHMLGIYNDAWWWCSPPIYIIVFGITIASLLLGILLERKFKIPYWKVMVVIGAVLLAYDFAVTAVSGLPNMTGLLTIAGIAGGWALLLLAIRKFWPASKKLLTRFNTTIMAAHLLDASSTFVALTFFGYYEQHVLPTFLIGFTGPWIMFPLKLAVVLPVLWYIDRSTESEMFKRFLKVVILILGLALGLRDMLTVGMMGL